MMSMVYIYIVETPMHDERLLDTCNIFFFYTFFHEFCLQALWDLSLTLPDMSLSTQI